jgi:hypothetical protein
VLDGNATLFSEDALAFQIGVANCSSQLQALVRLTAAILPSAPIFAALVAIVEGQYLIAISDV